MTEQQAPYTLFGNAEKMARAMAATRSVSRMIAAVYNELCNNVDNSDHALMLCLKWMEVWPAWSQMPAPEPAPERGE